MYFNKKGRLSAKFQALPGLAGLPPIIPRRGSIDSASSESESEYNRGLERAAPYLNEGCMVTKRFSYCNRLSHFVNAISPKNKFSPEVEGVIDNLDIIPFDFEDFTLDHPCNLVLLEPDLRASIDLFWMISIAPSSSTLDELIQIVKSNNDHRQRVLDSTGTSAPRSLDFMAECFLSPQYELVAVYPEHFRPGGSSLMVCEPETKTYVVARDRCLRESVDPNSPRFPPIYPRTESRGRFQQPNVFLVALSAEKVFHHYFETINVTPPPTPLPDHVLSLMRRTISLVRLLYWEPVPTKGFKGESIFAKVLSSFQGIVQGIASMVGLSKAIERSSDPDESGVNEEEDPQRPLEPNASAPSRRREKVYWPADMDLEARMAYGRALMSGHDDGYHWSLLEKFVEFDTSGSNSYDNVAAWQRSITDEI